MSRIAFTDYEAENPVGSVALIAHTTPNDIGGGAERTRGIAEGLRDLGYSVRWITLHPDSGLTRRRPEPWWYHRLRGAELKRVSELADPCDAVIVCYLPVAWSVRQLRLANGGAQRFIFSAENDEVALSGVSYRSTWRRFVASAQAEVVDSFDETWVPGETDAIRLRERSPGATVKMLASGIRKSAVSSRRWSPTPGAIFTYGSWQYPPNENGLVRLAQRLPESSNEYFTVFGRVPQKVRDRVARCLTADQHRGIRWAGFADALEDMPETTGGAGVVPVWEGAGSKLRVVELLALGVPIYAPQHAFVGLPGWVAELAGGVHDDPADLVQAATSHDEAAWHRAERARERAAAELSVASLVGAALAAR